MKLRGYEFFQAIGSPSRIVAPMVGRLLSASSAYLQRPDAADGVTGGPVGAGVPHALPEARRTIVLHAHAAQPAVRREPGVPREDV